MVLFSSESQFTKLYKFFKNFFQEQYQSVKLFGSRWIRTDILLVLILVLTICRQSKASLEQAKISGVKAHYVQYHIINMGESFQGYS